MAAGQKKTTPGPNPATATPDAERFLTLALHEENVLNNRLNIFLVAESILLVLALEVANSARSILDDLCYAGLAITAIWIFATWRQWLDLHYAGIALRKAWPALGVAYKPIPRSLKTANLLLMLAGLPAIFVVLWVLILKLPLPQPN